MNNIQVYQHNTLLLTVNVSNNSGISLTTFTPYFKILTGETAYSITGSTISVSGTTSFTIPSTVNALPVNVYEYEVYIQNDDELFTILSGHYTILPSLITN